MNNSVNINFDNANNYGRKINSASADSAALISAAKGINPGSVSSFSPGTVAKTEAIIDSINEITTALEEFEGNYSRGVNAYLEAYEEIMQEVNTLGVDINNSELLENVNIEVEEQIQSYFDYPYDDEGTENIYQVPNETVIECLKNNGAVEVGNGVYEYEMDGKTIRIKAVHTSKEDYFQIVKTNGLTSSYGDGQGVRCTFFSTSENPNFNDINNTITYCCGSQGSVNHINPSELNVNKNTLIAVVSNSNNAYMPATVAASTLTADFLAGGKEKKINNSIIGYSLGGLAAFKTAGDNPGLYDRLVCVNSCAHKGTTSVLNDEEYENLKDLDIVFVVTDNDPKFSRVGNSSPVVMTIGKLNEHNVPLENITVITNSCGGHNTLERQDSLVYRIAKELGEPIPSDINDMKIKTRIIDDDVEPRWKGHSGGYEVIDTLNLLPWLSEKRG